MPASTPEQPTNAAAATPPGETLRMVTVRMSESLHARLLAGSRRYAAPGGRPSMNRLCIDAIEAALDALDAEPANDEPQIGRGSAGTMPSAHHDGAEPRPPNKEP